MTNVVATICTDTDSRFISQLPLVSPPLTSGGMNLNLQSFTPQQIQSLITQFNAHVRVSEPQVPSSFAPLPCVTITEHGVMDPQCSSGIIYFPSINLTFENNTLHYKHHCISTLQSFLPKDAWIIDSRASSHVCSDLGMFDSFVPVSSVTITLPNGRFVPITHTGTIKITDSLILYDVLLVPDFQFNLISVSSLIRSLVCAAHFFPNGCLIQELSRGLMIGKGSLYNNLYILDSPCAVSNKIVFCGSISTDSSVWHQRLGHPSSSVFKNISTSLPSYKNIESDSFPCQVCPLAKQRRLAYVSHNNLASHPFDLIQMDV